MIHSLDVLVMGWCCRRTNGQRKKTWSSSEHTLRSATNGQRLPRGYQVEQRTASRTTGTPPSAASSLARGAPTQSHPPQEAAPPPCSWATWTPSSAPLPRPTHQVTHCRRWRHAPSMTRAPWRGGWRMDFMHQVRAWRFSIMTLGIGDSSIPYGRCRRAWGSMQCDVRSRGAGHRRPAPSSACLLIILLWHYQLLVVI